MDLAHSGREVLPFDHQCNHRSQQKCPHSENLPKWILDQMSEGGINWILSRFWKIIVQDHIVCLITNARAMADILGCNCKEGRPTPRWDQVSFQVGSSDTAARLLIIVLSYESLDHPWFWFWSSSLSNSSPLRVRWKGRLSWLTPESLKMLPWFDRL